MIRVNGSYFERYIFTVFPWIVVGGLILRFKTSNYLLIALAILATSGLLILLDYLAFRQYKLSNVTVTNNGLYVDDKKIEANEISVIRPYKNIPLLPTVFEIYLNDNTCLKFMDKPKTFLYKSNNKINSKSLDILFRKMPSLKSKMRAQNH